MLPRRSLTRTNLATALLAAAALLTSAGSSAHAQPPGIKAFFIGHSFFRPFPATQPPPDSHVQATLSIPENAA